MKPEDVFARDAEWEALGRFVETSVARLGIVTGRRRSGKTYLLRRLAQLHGGLYVAQVLGPHLELMARQWVSRYAADSTLNGSAGIVGRAEVPDAGAKVRREVDVVVLRRGERPGPGAVVLAIGECKLNATPDAVAQLDRAAELLAARGHGSPARKLLFTAAASPELRSLLELRPDIDLVDLDRLYGGC